MTQHKYFTIFNHEDEEAYLSDMHRHGWKLSHVTGLGCYHFVECTPENVSYRLDYNTDSTENRDAYLQIFRDCGWEYIQDFFGYSYFRKAVTDDKESEDIFCDEESRDQMLERVFKGRLLPMVVILTAVLLPQFVLNLSVYQNYVLSAVLGALIGFYVTVFAFFAVKYIQHKNRR